MRTKDRLLMAFRNLWRRKSRTILTILSVVIGTTSIIMMLSLGIGMQDQQKQMVESFGGLDTIEVLSEGTNPLKIDKKLINKLKNIKGVRVVIPHKDFHAEVKIKGKDKYEITSYEGVRVIPDDVFKSLGKEDFDMGQNLSSTDKNAALVSNLVEVDEMVKAPGQDWYNLEKVEDFDILAANYFIRLGYDYGDEGPNFGDQKETSSKPSSIDIPIKIKGRLSKKSFLGGYRIFINEKTYKIIKKEDEKLEFPQLENSYDMMGKPKNTNKKDIFDGLSVVCKDYESVADVEKKIQDLGYQTQSNNQMIEEINKSMRIVMLILGGIGSIAFIVSAIGIINTMLMSIYERQKEIGVMKVIGASIADIRAMFLLESGFIGFFGGLLGLLISIGLSIGLNAIFKSFQEGMMESDPVNLFSIPIWLAVVGVTFSAMVGVLAGYLPAKKATKLSAIDTLRSN